MLKLPIIDGKMRNFISVGLAISLRGDVHTSAGLVCTSLKNKWKYIYFPSTYNHSLHRSNSYFIKDYNIDTTLFSVNSMFLALQQ